jgi:hypothetical protein
MIIFNFSLVSLFIMKMMYYYDIVYRFFYKPTPIKIEKKDPIKEYPKKYKEKFNDLETIELDDIKLQNLKNCILYEQTPYSSIIMYYDIEFQKFNYYSNKSLPYNFLETACRKYALNFNCKSLYVDINKEYDIVKDKMKKNEERKEEEKKEEEKKEDDTKKNVKSIYVKPKAYNRKKKPKSRATIDENKEKIIDFKYCGRIVDFKFLKTNTETVKKLKTKNISFSEFKNRSNI